MLCVGRIRHLKGAQQKVEYLWAKYTHRYCWLQDEQSNKNAISIDMNRLRIMLFKALPCASTSVTFGLSHHVLSVRLYVAQYGADTNNVAEHGRDLCGSARNIMPVSIEFAEQLHHH